MGLQYQIAEETADKLRNWYQRIGYTDEESVALSSFVFSSSVEINNHIPAAKGWEIELRAPMIRTGIKNPKQQVFAHWMKGGWNRAGTWENVHESTEEIKASPSPLPRFGWNNATGMSADYYHYMQQCKRKIENTWLDPQDALSGIHTSDPVRLSKLPLGIEVYADYKNLCICADALEKATPAMDHVFAVDVSGSMRSRWVLVQLSLAALFKKLPEGAKVSVIAFSDNCQIIEQNIASGDLNGFMKTLQRIPLCGGFSRSIPVLQTAFGILRCMGDNGVVTMFTDDAFRSGFAAQDICNDYLREEAEFGNRLHLVCYGTDSWKNAELCKMGEIGGRMRTILSPEQLLILQNQHWEVNERRIYDFHIHPVGGSWQLLGGNTDESGRLSSFPLVSGNSTAAAFFNSSEISPGDVIPLCIEWKDEHNSAFFENINISVQPMSDSMLAALNEASELQALKG